MEPWVGSETKGGVCNGRSVPMRQVPTHVDDARDLLWRANEEGGVGWVTVARTGASSGTRAGRAPTWRTPRCRIDDRCPIENRFEPS